MNWLDRQRFMTPKEATDYVYGHLSAAGSPWARVAHSRATGVEPDFYFAVVLTDTTYPWHIPIYGRWTDEPYARIPTCWDSEFRYLWYNETSHFVYFCNGHTYHRWGLKRRDVKRTLKILMAWESGEPETLAKIKKEFPVLPRRVTAFGRFKMILTSLRK